MPADATDFCPPIDTFSVDDTTEQLLDSYKAIKVLGHGDMGAVFLVVNSETEQPLAMKVMSKDVLLRRNTSQRSNMEKDILSKLHHPLLPVLHNHFETDKFEVLVLDFCSGRDLNVLRHRQPEKKFSQAAVRFYGGEVVLALEHLHGLGIAYRDLKPENVLIQSNGHLMLTDFDLSIRLPPATPIPQGGQWKVGKKANQMFTCAGPQFEDDERTISGCMNPRFVRSFKDQRSKSRRGPTRVTPVGAKKTGQAFSFVGTAEYIAPEVLLGTGHDFSVDWWTLGILLYEMVYGKTPFLGPTRKDTFVNILSKEPQFPGPWSLLHDLIRRLLAKEPDQRLGFRRGAEEIKNHMFFHEVHWDMLEFVARPPFVPPPISLEDIADGRLSLEEHMAAIDLARSEKGRKSQRKQKSSSCDGHHHVSPEESHRPGTIVQNPVLQEAFCVF